jgi:hypothetical protein
MSDEVQAVAETDADANPGDPHLYVIVRKDVSPLQKYEDANWLIPTTEEEKASRIVDHHTLAQYVADLEDEGHVAVEGLSHEGNPVYRVIHEAGLLYVSWKRYVEEALGMNPSFPIDNGPANAQATTDLGTATLNPAGSSILTGTDLKGDTAKMIAAGAQGISPEGVIDGRDPEHWGADGEPLPGNPLLEDGEKAPSGPQEASGQSGGAPAPNEAPQGSTAS